MQCRSISMATARWLSLTRIRLFCDQGRFSLSLDSSYRLPFFHYAPCGKLCRNCLKHRSRNCIHLVENHPARVVCLRFAFVSLFYLGFAWFFFWSGVHVTQWSLGINRRDVVDELGFARLCSLHQIVLACMQNTGSSRRCVLHLRGNAGELGNA
jgi:hypothetical protein